MPMKVLEMIDRLVAVPTVSAVDPALDRGNLPLIEILAGWLDSEGWSVEILELPGQKGRKANLVATRGRGPGGLVLSGHSDTVPFDAGLWKSDPFRAIERDGKLFGLGVCDMKSFFALAIEASRAFEDRDLREPLVLVATADEESSMNGARALLETARTLGRAAIIGEPTGLKPVRMHKGVAMERIEIVGQSGHSSDPRLGRSALDAMHEAISELMTIRSELASNRRPELDPPEPTINFGRIAGGDNPNRICGSCILDYDVRLVPGMKIEDVRRMIKTRVEKRLALRGVDVRCAPLFDAIDPYETRPEAAIVRAATELTGHDAGAVSFGTEAPFLSKMGMDTLVLGPGDISVAHQPDEHLPLDRIDPMIAILRSLIARFCTDQK
jgi:acetylornithine deacetylase